MGEGWSVPVVLRIATNMLQLLKDGNRVYVLFIFGGEGGEGGGGG